MNKRILIACEESQEVATAFRKLGFEAYSCDIKPCSGGHPEYHIQGDVIPLLSQHWDLIIAHPPCTYLAVCGNRWFKGNAERWEKRLEAFAFFMKFVTNENPRIVIENPIGVASTYYRKPDQIIEPWQFGDEASKKTCLWLKGVSPLKPTKIVGKGEIVKFESGRQMPKWYCDAYGLPPEERSAIRSKTFPGIAEAMARQWGEEIEK